MRWFRSVAALFLTAVPVLAQTPPVIDSISPSLVVTTGGTQVQLNGHNFAGPFCFPVCGWPPYRVTFDGVDGTNVDVRSDSLVVVTTPPHSAGPVAVSFYPRDPTLAPVVVPNGVTYVESVPSLSTRNLVVLALVLSFAGFIALGASAPPN